MARCISPVFVKDKFRRHGRIGIHVPCGKCNYCLQTKRAQWSLRLGVELFHAVTSDFVTLTYAEDQMPINSIGLPELRKEDFQNFMKRLRLATPPKSLRYYAVGEYGTETERPHYHMILFGLAKSDQFLIENAWSDRGNPIGHVHFGSVTPASIHYVTKYVIQKEVAYPGREPPFSLMSRRPGIGAQYVDTHRLWHKDELRNYMKLNGMRTLLPRYFKDKLYDKSERAVMAALYRDQEVVQYLDEVVRLCKFHKDPYAYYEERFRFNHDKKIELHESI